MDSPAKDVAEGRLLVGGGLGVRRGDPLDISDSIKYSLSLVLGYNKMSEHEGSD